MRVHRGFTLVELLVVLVLAALLVGLVGPQLASGVPGSELRAGARDLASALRQARADAISSGEEQRLILNVEDNRFDLSGSGRSGSLPGDLRLRIDTSRGEVVDEHRAGIRFFADGSATGGRIQLNGNGRILVVDVDWLTGRTRIESPD